jgi:hypothetical protein
VIETVSERAGATKSDGRIEYNPQKQKVVPLPEGHKPSSKRIVFSRPVEEIRSVSKFLFDSLDEAAGIVGDKCFDLALQDALKQQEAE